MATVASEAADGVQALLKEVYLENGTGLRRMMRSCPLYANLAKQRQVQGSGIKIPVAVDMAPGGAQDISVLLDSAGPIGTTTDRVFTVSLVKDYAATWLDEFSLADMESNRASFLALMKRQVDGILDNLSSRTCIALYKSGTGAIGRGLGAASIAGTTLTLDNPDDVDNFIIGMQIVFAGTDGGDLRGAGTGDYVTVVAKDRDAGTIEVDNDLDGTITGLVDTDYVYPRGDAQNNAASAVKITGLAGWLPLATPASTAFWGVDRTEDPVVLAGHRRDVAGTPAEETIRVLAAKMFKRGGARQMAAYVGVMQLTAMCRRMEVSVEYDDAGGEVDYGFSSIVVHTAAGKVRVYADPFCPENRVYLLDEEQWAIGHLRDLPQLGASSDGLMSLRRELSDSVEVRAKQYLQLMGFNPKSSGVASCSLPGDLD